MTDIALVWAIEQVRREMIDLVEQGSSLQDGLVQEKSRLLDRLLDLEQSRKE